MPVGGSLQQPWLGVDSTLIRLLLHPLLEVLFERGELVSMIGNFRAYEATQRIIRQMDQSVQRLLRAVQ